MRATLALWIAFAVFCGGLAWKLSTWFRWSVADGEASTAAWSRLRAAARGTVATLFSRKLRDVLASLLLDVVVQRRILKQSALRWLAHLCISGSFVALLVMHALGEPVTARVFRGYQPTLNPYLFLRDLFALLLLVGLAVASYRRFVLKVPRLRSRGFDVYALAILGGVVVSGLLLEASKIASVSAYREMVRQYGDPGADQVALEAYWVERMGTVSPDARPTPELLARGRQVHEESCATCHSSTRWAFLGRGTSTLLGPVAAPLDRAGGPRFLWAIHFFACLVGLAILPFSKLFHLFATPVSLLVNGAVARGASPPATLATKRILELDACTHCCTCSVHCSVAMAAGATGNGNVLPSEKISALRALASGAELGPEQLRSLQEGVCLCTGCDRCTVACPSGIDLLGLWLAAKEALLGRGVPEYALLSPLSLRRGVLKDEIDPARYRAAIERPLRAIAARFRFETLRERSTVLAPENGDLSARLRRSLQADAFSVCFGCKTCTTACPVVRDGAAPQEVVGLLPHQVMYAARLGLWSLALGSRMIWDCLGCYQCQQHCPQGVRVTDVMYELKNVAVAETAAASAAAGGLP